MGAGDAEGGRGEIVGGGAGRSTGGGAVGDEEAGGEGLGDGPAGQASTEGRPDLIQLQRSGDVFNVTIGRGAHHIAIGRDIVQIDNSIQIPTIPVLALLGVVVAALVFLAVSFLGPATMGASTFNVAVAEIGALDAGGKTAPSEEGAAISQRIFDRLVAENARREDAFRVKIWHDSLPITAKRGHIGLVPGATPEDRDKAAAALAERLEADVVLYGHITVSEPRTLAMEFFVTQRLRAEANASLPVGGRYQLGQPIAIPAEFQRTDTIAKDALLRRVDTRAAGLLWLIRALTEEFQGRSGEVLALLESAERALPDWRERGEGKENLYYAKGRAALFLSDTETALAAFSAALDSNARYARASVGLGSVFLSRAQAAILAGGPLLGQPMRDLEQAFEGYRAGYDAAQATDDPLVAAVAQLGLAQAHFLKGQALDGRGDGLAAGSELEQAVGAAEGTLADLEAAGQFRLLAQGHQVLGAAHFLQAQLLEGAGDLPGSRRHYEGAVGDFAHCMAQELRAPEDEILRERIVGSLCRPQKVQAEGRLERLIERAEGG